MAIRAVTCTSSYHYCSGGSFANEYYFLLVLQYKCTIVKEITAVIFLIINTMNSFNIHILSSLQSLVYSLPYIILLLLLLLLYMSS